MIYGTKTGKRYANTSFDTFEVFPSNRKAIEACKRVATGDSDGVVLCGPVGTGKSHLLISTAREFDRLRSYTPEEGNISGEPMVKVPPIAELLERASEAEVDLTAPYLTRAEISRRTRVEYWMILDLAKALRADALDGGRLTEHCMQSDLLLLDDLGREKLTDFVFQEFERIIDFRYRNMLPIAVATNMDPKGIMKQYDDHTWSRWAQSCEIVEVLGKDYRLRRHDED